MLDFQKILSNAAGLAAAAGAYLLLTLPPLPEPQPGPAGEPMQLAVDLSEPPKPEEQKQAEQQQQPEQKPPEPEQKPPDTPPPEPEPVKADPPDDLPKPMLVPDDPDALPEPKKELPPLLSEDVAAKFKGCVYSNTRLPPKVGAKPRPSGLVEVMITFEKGAIDRVEVLTSSGVLILDDYGVKSLLRNKTKCKVGGETGRVVMTLNFPPEGK
ncbi:MAG: hypothetical protein EKK41_26960 [Hyphomicrobiales bacterium]|nr:MAG: hypothetical protein EKK41_26960 [Hyphomicrobiales bacterium]